MRFLKYPSSEALGQVPGGSGLGVNAEDHGVLANGMADAASFIACSCYDTPCLRSGDSDRLAPQGRIVALFDGRIKGIHVNVNDLPLGRCFEFQIAALQRRCKSFATMEVRFGHDDQGSAPTSFICLRLTYSQAYSRMHRVFSTAVRRPA